MNRGMYKNLISPTEMGMKTNLKTTSRFDSVPGSLLKLEKLLIASIHFKSPEPKKDFSKSSRRNPEILQEERFTLVDVGFLDINLPNCPNCPNWAGSTTSE